MRAFATFGIIAALLARLSPSSEASAASDAATPDSEAFLSFVYSPSLPTFPPSHHPPVVVSLVPVDVPPGTMKEAPWCAPGHVELILDNSGRVTTVRFSSDTDAGPLAAPIRAALRQWQFEPVFADNRSKEVIVTLTYFVATSVKRADANDDAPASPRLTYSVEADRPPAFFRGRKSADPVYVDIPAPERVVQMVPSRPGSTQYVPVVTNDRFRSASPSIRYTSSSAALPWLQTRVTTLFDIQADGKPSNIRVVDSICALLDPEAVAAVRAWRFAPAAGQTSAETRDMIEQISFDAPVSGLPGGFIQPVPEERKRPKWITPPRFARFTLPVFPTLLARAKKQGDAIARVSLDEQGTITDIRITQAKHEEFGLALREAILGCSFEPARNAAGPIASVIQLTARFAPDPDEFDISAPYIPALSLNAESSEVVPVDRLDREPRMLIGRMPMFRSLGAVGPVSMSGTLELVIDPSGRVRAPIALNTSAPEVGYAAVQAAASWLFEPPTAQGKPVATKMQITFGSGEADRTDN